MLFNSIEFAIFIVLVFALYWILRSFGFRAQNVFILVSSYFFYAWWDWRFLALLGLSTVVDYVIGLKMEKDITPKLRKALLFVSIFVNFGILGFFKYYNFFVDSFVDAFSLFGKNLNIKTLQIILPVGISFYTFQTISYTVDIYKRRISPTKDLIAFAGFVSFFPQLVAGPIERARSLLPQFLEPRKFNITKASDGLRQILWGLFKKVVIADNCGVHVDYIFSNSHQLDGATLLLGAILFAFQCYGDFSGYSDIAIGTARLLGFNLMRNFRYPFFSRSIVEFWRKWHISLITWFKDYVYIPLGGSKGNTWLTLRNVYIVFALTGFWHGASWNFLLWGVFNAILMTPLIMLNNTRQHSEIIAEGRWFPTSSELIRMIFTFFQFVLGLIIFRTTDLTHAKDYFSRLFTGFDSFFTLETYMPNMGVLAFAGFMVCIEWFSRKDEHALEHFGLNWVRLLRWLFYGLLVFFIGYFTVDQEMPFIYFQF